MLYGDKELKGLLEKSAPAIIDTGANTLGVPGNLYKALREEWKGSLGEKTKLDCLSNEDFCQLKESCDGLSKQLKPIGF